MFILRTLPLAFFFNGVCACTRVRPSDACGAAGGQGQYLAPAEHIDAGAYPDGWWAPASSPSSSSFTFSPSATLPAGNTNATVNTQSPLCVAAVERAWGGQFDRQSVAPGGGVCRCVSRALRRRSLMTFPALSSVSVSRPWLAVTLPLLAHPSPSLALNRPSPPRSASLAPCWPGMRCKARSRPSPRSTLS
jgi:hypothetical protein